MKIQWTLLRSNTTGHVTWVAYYKDMLCPIDARHSEWLTKRGRSLCRLLARRAFQHGART